MFDDTTLLLIWIATTWAVSNIVLGFIGIFQVADNTFKIQLLKHLDKIIHRVRVEKDQDTYYWYDHDNGAFLAQGQSDEEIINHLKTRFPTHIFYLPTSHFISQKTDWKPRHHHIESVDQ
jgi:hypothetical protein